MFMCVCECVNVLQEGLCHFTYPYSIFVIYMFLVDVNKVIIISRNSTTASLSHITYIFNTLRNRLLLRHSGFYNKTKHES